MEVTSRCTLGSHEQHIHSLEVRTRSIQQSTSTHTQHFRNIQQQKNNHIQRYCELFGGTLENCLLPYITANIQGFNQMDPPAQTIAVTLDMSKAYDTINIHTLIRKLLQTNIPGTYTAYITHTSIQHQF